MDRTLTGSQEHEIETLARKYGTTVNRVREIITHTRSRSRQEIEEALEQCFPEHRAHTEEHAG